MISSAKTVLCSAVAVCLMVVSLFAPSFVAASGIVNDKSPFIDAVDPGAADEVNVIGTQKQQQDSLINVIKGRINRVLGIMALVALAIVIYGGILMVTSAGADDRYQKGFTILRQAVIGLLIIGIAWFIVSLIFWLINRAGRPAEGSGACTGLSC